jgi:hypothetical protein
MLQLKRKFFLERSRNLSFADNPVASVAFEASIASLPNPGTILLEKFSTLKPISPKTPKPNLKN